MITCYDLPLCLLVCLSNINMASSICNKRKIHKVNFQYYKIVRKNSEKQSVVCDFNPAPAIKHSAAVITNKHRYRVNHTLQINFDKRGRAGNNVFIEK